MEAREVLMREVAHLAQDKRERVAESDHDRRAGARREAQRADFFQRAIDERDISLARQRARGVAGDCHQGASHLPHRSEEPNDFLALAAVRQRQHQIMRMQHAQIAVDGAGGVEDIGAGSGGIERAGDLLPDVRRLARPRNGDPA